MRTGSLVVDNSRDVPRQSLVVRGSRSLFLLGLWSRCFTLAEHDGGGTDSSLSGYEKSTWDTRTNEIWITMGTGRTQKENGDTWSYTYWSLSIYLNAQTSMRSTLGTGWDNIQTWFLRLMPSNDARGGALHLSRLGKVGSDDGFTVYPTIDRLLIASFGCCWMI